MGPLLVARPSSRRSARLWALGLTLGAEPPAGRKVAHRLGAVSFAVRCATHVAL